MKIIVIDGQGGRIGSLIISKIKASSVKESVIAIGTNSMATSSMLKAGADKAATGENPVVINARDADFIIGPIGIISADALLGEITPAMANAVSSSHAFKILIPTNQCNHYIAGIKDTPLGEMITDAINRLEDAITRVPGLYNSSDC